MEMRRHPIWGYYAQHLMGTFTPPKVELGLSILSFPDLSWVATL